MTNNIMRYLFLASLILALVAPVESGLCSSKKKVLYIDSYHKGYPWSEGITRGVTEALKVTLDDNDNVDDSKSRVAFKVIRMDTNNNTSEEFKQDAAKKAKSVIEAWRPDVVIASDDNASKYLIVPYYRNAELPFVFCGVNWDASSYGFPCYNVTGMIEVSLIPKLIETMRFYAKGDRLGLLGADNISNRKEAENYKRKFKLSIAKEVFVEDIDQWKEEYRKMQDEVDMLIMAPPSFLQDEAEKKEAADFVERNTSIPTGFIEDWIAPFAMIGYVKVSKEQGEWAAETAQRILNGEKPSDIAVVSNKEGELILNLKLAKSLGIVFPYSMLKNAAIIDEE